MRPPSIGKPGRRLNRPSETLMKPSQPNVAWTCGWAKAPSMARKMRPIRTLEAGPAAAMSASSRGRRGSSSRCAAPPKMKRVMLVTRSPKRRATRAWLSSWASTLAKKRRLMPAATIQ